jgi:hypothetical protein
MHRSSALSTGKIYRLVLAWLIILLLLSACGAPPATVVSPTQVPPTSTQPPLDPTEKSSPLPVETATDAPPVSTGDPQVAAMIAGIQQDEVTRTMEELTGLRSVTVGGESVTFIDRSTGYDDINLVTEFIYDTLASYGLDVSYQDWYDETEDISGRNVIGEITGTVSPDEIVIISAHIDEGVEEDGAGSGADDNATGSAAVLLAAEQLAGKSFERTVRFVIFTGEEDGCLGSYAYAQESSAKGENIVAVISMDMIGYDNNSDGAIDLHIRENESGDQMIADTFSEVVTAYGIDLEVEILPDNNDESDHISFWEVDYPAVLAIEDFDDFNPAYHASADTLDNLDISYLTSFIQAGTGAMAVLAVPVSQ